MFGQNLLPLLLAQAGSPNANSLGPLALRRWFWSLTLSSPASAPSLHGLWDWGAGFLALIFVVALFQGIPAAASQVFDIRGHRQVFAAALTRIGRSGRVAMVVIGLTVVAWSCAQLRTYRQPSARDDLIQLLKSRSLGELAVEQGALAGLTPLRDLCSLGDNLLLLTVVVVLLLRFSSDTVSGPYIPVSQRDRRGTRWAQISLFAGIVYGIYRTACIVIGAGDLPAGVGAVIDALGIAGLMLICDAVLLAWALVELRNASLGDAANETFSMEPIAAIVPASALACLAALPSRYVAMVVWLLPDPATSSSWTRFVRWQLSWGLADVQAATLVTVGIAGVVAWTRGGIKASFQAYFRLLQQQGGRLVVLLIAAALAAGSASALAYLLVLALPAQSWVLSAADGYAHYATLPIGLLTLAALIELGERTLPYAETAPEPLADPANLETERADEISPTVSHG